MHKRVKVLMSMCGFTQEGIIGNKSTNGGRKRRSFDKEFTLLRGHLVVLGAGQKNGEVLGGGKIWGGKQSKKAKDSHNKQEANGKRQREEPGWVIKCHTLKMWGQTISWGAKTGPAVCFSKEDTSTRRFHYVLET